MNRKQRRIFSSIIAGFLAFLMFFSLFANLFFGGSALTASESNLKKLKESLAQTAAEKKNIEGEIKEIKDQKNSVLKQIQLLDSKIDSMEKEISLHSAIIAQLGELITEKEKQIADTQAKEDAQYAKLKERVRVMYEHGDVSYLGVLLESDGFFDFLSRYEIISQISSYEKKLFNEIKQLKAEIVTQKEDLETNKTEEISMKSQLQSKKNELDTQMDEKEKNMQKIEKAEDQEKDKLIQVAEEEERLAAEIKKMAAEIAAQNKKDYVGGTFTWPCPGYTRISSVFGMRYHPVLHVNKLHTGTDVAAPKGAKIVAMNDGKIITSTYSAAYGNYVIIDHGGNVVTLYAHMSSRSVKNGDSVKKGQQIGLVGSTGYSTGAHLHFEVIKNGGYVNPMSFFN